MFSNAYQSGMYIEIFNSQNKDLVKNWKFSSKIAKEYDATVKGYVNVLNGAVSKMQIPANDKQFLGIVQSYIVFQMYIFTPNSLGIEIAISDTSKTKRRLMFSTSSKDIVINPLHCRIPLMNIPIGVWVNLSIDVLSFVSECFKTQTFRSIDFINVTANCKVRRIFSMRSSLMEYENNCNDEFPLEYGDVLPKGLTLPSTVLQENININIDKLKLSLESELKHSKDSVNLGNVSYGNINGNNSNGNYQNSNNNNNNNMQYDKRNLEGNNNNSNGLKQSNLKKNICNNANILSPNNNLNKIGSGFSNNNLRSKSQNKPLHNLNNKSNNGELLNKQEFIKRYKVKYDPKSKSPEKPDAGLNIKDNKAKVNSKFLNLKNAKANINTNNASKPNAYINLNKNKKSPNRAINKQNDNNFLRDIDNGKLTEENFNREIKSNMLLNTLNYKNIDKWDNSNNGGDSIEEIYEIDDKRTFENNQRVDTEAGVDRVITGIDDKQKYEESDDKFYYDIPIKDFKKKSLYKESGNYFNPKLTGQIKQFIDNNNNKEDNSKRKMIEEILRDSYNNLNMIDKDRPFTPPFTKLVPMSTLRKSFDKSSSIILERAKEEITTSLNTESKENRESSKSPDKNNRLKDSLEPSSVKYLNDNNSNNNNHLDLIYDHVLGCYYDPKTNMYYELKN